MAKELYNVEKLRESLFELFVEMRNGGGSVKLARDIGISYNTLKRFFDATKERELRAFDMTTIAKVIRFLREKGKLEC